MQQIYVENHYGATIKYSTSPTPMHEFDKPIDNKRVYWSIDRGIILAHAVFLLELRKGSS
jgi:hypothetical protein